MGVYSADIDAKTIHLFKTGRCLPGDAVTPAKIKKLRAGHYIKTKYSDDDWAIYKITKLVKRGSDKGIAYYKLVYGVTNNASYNSWNECWNGGIDYLLTENYTYLGTKEAAFLEML